MQPELAVLRSAHNCARDASVNEEPALIEAGDEVPNKNGFLVLSPFTWHLFVKDPRGLPQLVLQRTDFQGILTLYTAKFNKGFPYKASQYAHFRGYTKRKLAGLDG